MTRRRVPAVERDTDLLRLVREPRWVPALLTVPGGPAAASRDSHDGRDGRVQHPPGEVRQGQGSLWVSADEAPSFRVNVRWVTPLGEDTASMS